MKIGVFDSGVGGKSMALAIESTLPEHTVLLREDHDNLPYGNKTPAELLKLVLPIMKEMQKAGCDVIVVACNTVTTNIIAELREALDTPIVAMEPMIKPAAAYTTSKVIAVCATPATLQSARYAWLKEQYAQDVKVLEPDCSDWAAMIEEDHVDGAKIAARINEVLAKKADVIVLGCTHYHWIEHQIRILSAGKAKVMQPEKPVLEQLKRVIAGLQP